jgi:DNA-binding NtrC family response regulator
MELRTNTSSINRSTHKAQGQLADGAKPKRRTAEDSEVPSKRASTIDARIGSLRILAQSLIRQIEILEADAASASSDDFDAQSEVRRFEAELIRSALIKTGGRQRRAARILGMKVTTLNTKIKRYRITLDESSATNDNESGILADQSLKPS